MMCALYKIYKSTTYAIHNNDYCNTGKYPCKFEFDD